MSDDPNCTNCGHLLSKHAYGEAPCYVGEPPCGCRDFSTRVDWEARCKKAESERDAMQARHAAEVAAIVARADEIVNTMNGGDITNESVRHVTRACAEILALTPEDAREALDRLVHDAYERGRTDHGEDLDRARADGELAAAAARKQALEDCIRSLAAQAVEPNWSAAFYVGVHRAIDRIRALADAGEKTKDPPRTWRVRFREPDGERRRCTSFFQSDGAGVDVARLINRVLDVDVDPEWCGCVEVDPESGRPIGGAG